MDPDRRAVLRLVGAAALAGIAGCSTTEHRRQPPGAADGRVAQGSPRTAPGTIAPTPASTPGTAASGPSSPVAVEVDSGSRALPRVALTFHGQGRVALATALLAELERAGARATVLAVGTWLEEHPEMARRILDGGHDLGNHTMHHRPMARMDTATALAEIAEAAAVLRRSTGSIGRWFRPSGTPHASPAVLAAAAPAGYRQVLGYDVDSLDYTDPGAAAVARVVLAGVRPGSVVSLHLGHAGTVTAMPEILAGLSSRGLTAVTASDLLGAVG